MKKTTKMTTEKKDDAEKVVHKKVATKKVTTKKVAPKNVATKNIKSKPIVENAENIVTSIFSMKNLENINPLKDMINFPSLNLNIFSKNKEAKLAELDREKVKEKEVEDFLLAPEVTADIPEITKSPEIAEVSAPEKTAEIVEIPEELESSAEISGTESVAEKNTHHYYLYALVVVLIVIVLAIFGAYKMFFSKDQISNNINATVNQNSIAPVVVVPAPVEQITITDSVATSSSQKPAIVTSSDTKNLQESAVFKSFNYDSTLGKLIALSGTCHDKYYAFLIFDSKIDYRVNPGMAQSNKAYTCPVNGKFMININLKDFNLQTGKYYIFVADQGAGAWYNPR